MILRLRCIMTADDPLSTRMPRVTLRGTFTTKGCGQRFRLFSACTPASMDATLPCAAKPMLVHFGARPHCCSGFIGIVMQAGLRAYVGKVCMDRNSKDYYKHSPEQNLADTEAFVRHVRSCPKEAHHVAVLHHSHRQH